MKNKLDTETVIRLRVIYCTRLIELEEDSESSGGDPGFSSFALGVKGR